MVRFNGNIWNRDKYQIGKKNIVANVLSRSRLLSQMIEKEVIAEWLVG
jgi:hypothetical protein